MKYFLASLILFSTTTTFSQTSWKIQVDSSFKVMNRYSKITGCADGGIAIAGIDNTISSFIYKTDSIGNYQWSNYYYQNITDPAPYEAIQLRATSDTGFYFLMQDELDMFGWFSTPFLQKINKYGIVTNSIGMTHTGSWGNNLYLGAIEKNNNNLYGVGAGSNYDSVNDEVCCWQGYSFKLDTTLNILRKTGYNYLFYDSLNAPFNAFNTQDTNGRWTGFDLYDTSGYHFANIQYSTDTILGINRGPRSYCQDDNNYYFLEILDKNFFYKPCLHKVDKNFNTIYSMVLDTANILPNMLNWADVKIDKKAEGNLLVVSLFNNSGGRKYPFMMEIDTSGNILYAYVGDGSDSSYISCNIDTISGSALFASQNKLENFSRLNIQREFLSAPSCGFIPVNLNIVPITIADSLFVTSDTLTEGNEPVYWHSTLPETDFNLLAGFPVCGVFSGNMENAEHQNCNPLIYPNPANNQINISFNCETDQKTDVKIFNCFGAEIFSKIISTSGETNFDVKALPNGIYFIKFQSNDQYAIIRKLIINH